MKLYTETKLFVEKKELTETLFQSGGTADGYYKTKNRDILFYGLDDCLLGVLDSHCIFCSAKRYIGISPCFGDMKDTIKLLGIPSRFGEQWELAQELYAKVFGKPSTCECAFD